MSPGGFLVGTGRKRNGTDAGQQHQKFVRFRACWEAAITIKLAGDLDQLNWNMVGEVKSWRA